MKIQDYGIIGDCRAAALIGRNGSLDWLCWPQFESPSVFAGILDPERGGHWRIEPTFPYKTSRKYVEETNVLETSFISSDGVCVLTDLMPVASEDYKHRRLTADHEVLRRIRCAQGEAKVRLDFQPRPNYGLTRPKIRSAGKLGLRFEDSSGIYWLRSTQPLAVDDSGAHAEFPLRAGEQAQFSLSHAEQSPAVLPCLGPPADERIRVSLDWWRGWARQAQYRGPYREAVVRSALVLRLFTYSPSGAIAAAPTTSLPETLGGNRNWDYRFCWLRDASLTTRALTGLGYWNEAEAFLFWMLQTTRLTKPEVRILYTVFGEKVPRERDLDHLRGYRGSRPVRIGNAARNQLQLDVYGEVIDAASRFALGGRQFDRATQKVLIGFGKYVAENWQQPDEGIWEPRSGRAHHTHSRLLCWTAFDRLARLAKQGVLKGAPSDLFIEAREKIRRDIQENAWNENLRTYVSTLGGDEVDSSLLLMPWYGFETADSERMTSTYGAIDRALRAGPALLYRYRTEPAEGAFGICGFWEAEYLALGGGSLPQARDCFEKLISYRNDLGLFAEEIDPKTGDALGNFPQAFTHIGLINAALSLQEREEGKAPSARQEALGMPREGVSR